VFDIPVAVLHLKAGFPLMPADGDCTVKSGVAVEAQLHSGMRFKATDAVQCTCVTVTQIGIAGSQCCTVLLISNQCWIQMNCLVSPPQRAVNRLSSNTHGQVIQAA
jgi:hypothetical protein